MNLTDLLAEASRTDLDQLSVRTQRFTHAASRVLGVTLERGHKHDQAEALTGLVRVNLPQDPAHPLNTIEPMALIWEQPNDPFPHVVALRDDFPATPHRNLVNRNFPPTLCLFERAVEEYLNALTPERFLRRILQWFDDAAMGTLYHQSQQLEPFVLGAATLICSSDHLTSREPQLVCAVTPQLVDEATGIVPETRKHNVFYSLLPKERTREAVEACQYITLNLEGQPVDGTIIRNYPKDFAELAALLAQASIDLIKAVREASLLLLYDDKRLLNKHWMFVIHLPKHRPDGEVEELEHLAFVLEGVTIGQLGVSLGQLGNKEGYAPILQPHTIEDDSVGAPVALNPVQWVTRSAARRYSGILTAPWTDKRVLAVGAGALGSQTILNLARQGVGSWDIVDNDVLLPHNLTRHGLYDACGRGKAHALIETLRRFRLEDRKANALDCNVLKAESQATLLDQVATSAAICDFSASRAVLHHLALISNRPPALAAYLTAAGRFLVVLAEGNDQQTRIDDLDLAFAAACAAQERFATTFATSPETVRYGGSCGSVTTILPQGRVALHAAILSEFLKCWLAAPSTQVVRWELTESLELSRNDFAIEKPLIITLAAGWNLRLAPHALQTMQSQREQYLPNEACGVLLGAFDFTSESISVALALPPPPDSDLNSTGCRRGNRRLRTEIDAHSERSGNLLSYVGEWHSHPKGSGASPSPTDLEALETLHATNMCDGAPTLMLIIADDEQVGVVFRFDNTQHVIVLPAEASP